MEFRVARAMKHMWEEPVISGAKGSGTIFFSGCRLHCCYCQNYNISHKGKGLNLTGRQLLALMFWLQNEGAHNINLVTPSHVAAALRPVLQEAKRDFLKIPVVYNTGGYDGLAGLRALDGLIDIYLPDLKYVDAGIAQKYSGAADYFEIANAALREMRRQQPRDVFIRGLMRRGVLVRHLVLPNLTSYSCAVLDAVAAIDKTLYVSVMAQYFPTADAQKFPELSRRLTNAEYDAVCGHFFAAGLRNGFTQDPESAVEDYVPDFDLDLLRADVAKAEELFGGRG
ncbi:MAG: radical SAM protein [Firmicutes bacterium]|nr:radical SAM protein [Bacillota bacterium]